MVTKRYCVLVYGPPFEYDNVHATDPVAAKHEVLAHQLLGREEDVGHVEVMRQCECGYVTSLDERTCEDCGAPL